MSPVVRIDREAICIRDAIMGRLKIVFARKPAEKTDKMANTRPIEISKIKLVKRYF